MWVGIEDDRSPSATSRGAAADNAETIGWSVANNHTTLYPHPTGGYQRLTPPSRAGRTGAARWEIAAPTARAGARAPCEDATSEAPEMEEGVAVKEEFGSAPGEEAGRAKQECTIPFVAFFFFFCSADWGKGDQGALLEPRISVWGGIRLKAEKSHRRCHWHGPSSHM